MRVRSMPQHSAHPHSPWRAFSEHHGHGRARIRSTRGRDTSENHGNICAVESSKIDVWDNNKRSDLNIRSSPVIPSVVAARTILCVSSPAGRLLSRGLGVGIQKFVYQKWPDQIFPVANFVFSRDGPFGLGGRGSPRWFLIILKTPCPRVSVPLPEPQFRGVGVGSSSLCRSIVILANRPGNFMASRSNSFNEMCPDSSVSASLKVLETSFWHCSELRLREQLETTCNRMRGGGGWGIQIMWIEGHSTNQHRMLVPPPTLVLTRAARFWFRGQKCGNRESPCLDKPGLPRGMYHGTHVADISQPSPSKPDNTKPAHTPAHNSTWNCITATPTLCQPY